MKYSISTDDANTKIQLDNAQANPHLTISINDKQLCDIYFCKDGGIIRTTKSSVGVRMGDRYKDNQTKNINAEITDGIIIK